MKRIIKITGLVAALFLFTLSMSAQERKSEDIAKYRTDNMKTKLSLTEDQYKKAYDATLEFVTASKALREQSELSKAEKLEKLKGLDEAMDEKMKSVLTPEQFKNYLAMKKDNRQKIKELKQSRL